MRIKYSACQTQLAPRPPTMSEFRVLDLGVRRCESQHLKNFIKTGNGQSPPLSSGQRSKTTIGSSDSVVGVTDSTSPLLPGCSLHPSRHPPILPTPLIFTECIAGVRHGVELFRCVNPARGTQAPLSPLGEPGAKECADLTTDTCHLPSGK